MGIFAAVPVGSGSKIIFQVSSEDPVLSSGGSVRCLSLDDGHHGLTSRSGRRKIPLLILSL